MFIVISCEKPKKAIWWNSTHLLLQTKDSGKLKPLFSNKVKPHRIVENLVEKDKLIDDDKEITNNFVDIV